MSLLFTCKRGEEDGGQVELPASAKAYLALFAFEDRFSSGRNFTLFGELIKYN